jgi:hypothetical protein
LTIDERSNEGERRKLGDVLSRWIQIKTEERSCWLSKYERHDKEEILFLLNKTLKKTQENATWYQNRDETNPQIEQ